MCALFCIFMENYFNQFKENWKLILVFKRTDRYIILSTIASTVFIWILMFYYGSLSTYFNFKITKLNIFISKNTYNGLEAIDNEIHPLVPVGLPLILKFLRLICINSTSISCALYIFCSSAITSLLFERLLSTWKLVRKPYVTACFLSFFPMRYLMLHSIVSSDTIYLLTAFLTLLSYRTRDIITMSIAIYICALSDLQCIVLVISYSIIYFSKHNYNELVLCNFCYCAGILTTAIIQQFYGYTLFDYIRYMFNDFQPCPFYHFCKGSMSIVDMGRFHAFTCVYGFSVLGVANFIDSSFILVLISGVQLVFSSFEDYKDTFRYTVLLEIIGILMGYDAFIYSEGFYKLLPLFILYYLFFAYTFAYNNIVYNTANYKV